MWKYRTASQINTTDVFGYARFVVDKYMKTFLKISLFVYIHIFCFYFFIFLQYQVTEKAKQKNMKIQQNYSCCKDPEED